MTSQYKNATSKTFTNKILWYFVECPIQSGLMKKTEHLETKFNYFHNELKEEIYRDEDQEEED